MRRLTSDIVESVHRHFAPADVPRALEIMERHADVLSIPRVRRSVLFLAGGSVSMLRHYAASAALDVREILARAEYVAGIAEPALADSEPRESTGTSRSVGPSPRTAAAPRRVVGHAHPTRRADEETVGSDRGGPSQRDDACTDGSRRHRHLIGGSFVLGDAEYTVTEEQDHTERVRCLRCAGDIVSIVHLPLVFVVEQLSEHIELHGDPG